MCNETGVTGKRNKCDIIHNQMSQKYDTNVVSIAMQTCRKPNPMAITRIVKRLEIIVKGMIIKKGSDNNRNGDSDLKRSQTT